MPKAQPMDNMKSNMAEVSRLLDIHASLTGRDRGRRYDVEVLNKSAIVMITACWEALVEDLASEGFDFLLKEANSPEIFPAKVRTLASRTLKEANDETKIWDLAGDGWKNVLITHRNKTINRLVGSLNTPRAENVDRMFAEVLGLNTVSSTWYWGKLTAEQTREKLSEFVELRGSIAHRVTTAGSVTKKTVRNYRAFAFRLGVKTSNRVNTHIYKLVGKAPWSVWKFGSVS